MSSGSQGHNAVTLNRLNFFQCENEKEREREHERY